MHTDFDKLSDKGKELAYGMVALMAGSTLINGVMKQISDEQKAAAEPTSVDGGPGEYNELAGTKAEEEHDDESRTENGHEGRLTTEQAASIFGAANEELITLANGGKWPAPRSIDQVFESELKRKPQPVTEDLLQVKVALIQANTGVAPDLNDPEARKMLEQLTVQENTDRAKFFAERLLSHKQLVIERATELELEANRHRRSTFAQEFDNLPEAFKLRCLRGVDSAINTRCNNLTNGTGKLAGIPALTRASEITVLRADQKQVVREWLKQLAHANPTEVRPNREPAQAAA